MDETHEAIDTILRKHNYLVPRRPEIHQIYRPVSGTIDCPKCGKKLTYRIHSNGHIHGECSANSKVPWSCLTWKE